jgi:hypothetical protein
MAQGAESQHILVLRDCGDIIVDEFSRQTVQVAAERHDHTTSYTLPLLL